MRNIVNEDGEIIAKATKEGTLIGGHHRIMLAGSLSQKLFWQDNRRLRSRCFSCALRVALVRPVA